MMLLQTNTVAQVQTNFNFDVKNTLEETLQDFFKANLNKNVEKMLSYQ